MNMKPFLNVLLVTAWVLTAFSSPVSVVAQSSGGEITPGTLYVPGEVVVGFPDGQAPEAYAAQASALAGSIGAQVVDAFANVALLQFAEDADVNALAAQIGGMEGVAYAEPNYIRWIPEYLADPNAEHKDRWVNAPHPRTEVTFRLKNSQTNQEQSLTLSLSELRSMKTIRNGQAVPTWPTDPDLWSAWGWDYSNASIIWPDKAANPAVCVIDSGVDGKHPDLVGRVLPGYDFVNEDSKPDDDNGHGTHVAGTISAVMNNKKGIAGISTAKIVPVKVLSAQGWSTSFDIAQGITYCANHPAVKVINMSLGGPGANSAEYNALDYAINTKGKLVVVAAGNDSAYAFHFPAAWAVNWVCKDGSDAYGGSCAPGNANALSAGLISVGAAASPWGFWNDGANGGAQDGLIWVDTNGDGAEPGDSDPTYWDEHFWPPSCATTTSNYGAWVEIVAPGQDILSTQPVSYNFHNRYFWGADGDGDGYESQSGTSMAAPHVAGGAARVWSAFPSETNAQIATRLQTSLGWPGMVLAMDPNIIDPAAGYNDSGYQGEAPFCWPNNSHGGQYDMSSAVYLDVADAMERFAWWQPVSDAVTGLPLAGATVSAYVGTNTTPADRAIVSRDDAVASLLNLRSGTSYNIKVSKAGYTSGNVTIGSTSSCIPGYWCGASEGFAIPPIGRISAVASWFWWGSDLDLYTWLPNVSSPGGVVGSGYWNYAFNPDLNWAGEGELSDYPRARRNRDGGAGDWLGMESVSIVPRPGFPTMPYYNQTSGDYYDFLLTDYGSGDLNQPLVFRVWVGGKIVGYVKKTVTCDTDGADDTPGNADDEVWWYAGWMNFGTFTASDTCGKAGAYPGGIWPYARLGGIQGIPGLPHKP
jgi:subtilisin family serine protease